MLLQDQATGVGELFAAGVEDALAEGRPLPRHIGEEMGQLTIQQLKGWLRNLDVRDKLLMRVLPFQRLQDRARRYKQSKILSVSALLTLRRQGKSPRPSPAGAIGFVRLQNEHLFSELETKERMRAIHALEVSVCPVNVREAMRPYMGVSFTTNIDNVELSQNFLPALKVCTQTLSVVQKPGGQMSTILVERPGLYVGSSDDSYGLAFPDAGTLYDFDMDLSDNGDGMPVSKKSTIINGIDMHRAVEDVALSNRPCSEFIDMPRGYLRGNSECAHELNWKPGLEIPEALEHALMSRLALFWERGGQPEACRQNNPGFACENLWIDEAVNLGISDKLPAPMPAREVYRILDSAGPAGDGALHDMMRAVFLSSVRRHGGDFYFPIDLYMVEPGAPPEGTRELFVHFDSAHFGRDSYQDLVRSTAATEGRVQVVHVGE